MRSLKAKTDTLFAGMKNDEDRLNQQEHEYESPPGKV